MKLEAVLLDILLLNGPVIGPPPLEPVASWVLSGALTLTLAALSFFLVRTYKRIEKLEDTTEALGKQSVDGRQKIMEKVEEGHRALATQIKEISAAISVNTAAIASINKEISLRVEFARRENDQHKAEHQQFFDQLKDMARRLAERRTDKRYET